MLLVAGTVVGCEQILRIPDRKPGDNVSSCADGACTCDPGFGDCNGEPADGCEAPLAGDEASANCGACGHDCLGGVCGTNGCEETLAPFDMIESHIGPVVWEGEAFVAELSTHRMLVLRAGASELTGAGEFTGDAIAFESNDHGAFLLTLPPEEQEPDALPPYHASVFRVDSTGTHLETVLELGELYNVSNFAFTSGGWYMSLYDPEVGFRDLYRFDRATGAASVETYDFDGVIGAHQDTLYWSFQSDLVEQPEGGAADVVLDVEPYEFDQYVTRGGVVYAYDPHIPETGLTKFARIDRTAKAQEVIEADVDGLAIDERWACWLDETNGKVWLWTHGEAAPKEIVGDMHFAQFGWEQFFCAHDATSTFWLDQKGLYRRVKPLELPP